MQRMEQYAEEHNFPIIGPAAGYHCYQIARMIRARSIFEMGSGYGYSTAWFARAVRETCAEQGSAGGVLIVDNILWHGRVFDKSDKSDSTEGVREFTRLITGDPDWIVSLLPVRDGLIVAYKK